ncbi:MAG TPA: hypothetical protein VFH88_09020 [Candidatus Krumholzibacteria bacterium]|nr:hypothetical protein [Candidatus Krumholzibacteria bacterium]
MVNLKKVMLVSLLVVSVAAPAFASRDLIELMRSDLRTEKMGIVTQAMHLSDEQADKFWPVYKEYESQMVKLNDQRVELIKEYASQYDTMTNETAKSLIDRAFKLQEARSKTLKKYVSKMGKSIDMKTAARWAQVEQALNSAIDLQVASQLPLLQ